MYEQKTLSRYKSKVNTAISADGLHCHLKPWVTERVVCLFSKFLGTQSDCNTWL